MKYLIMILLTFGGSFTTFAQSLGIGPVLGYQKAPDAEEGSFLGGAAVRLGLNDAITLEGANLVRSEKYVHNTIKVTNYPVMVSGLFYVLPILYGTVGAGWYNSKIEYNIDVPGILEPGDQSHQDFGWHFGGGVEFPLRSKVNLTGDIRYVFLNYEFEDVPGSNDIQNDFFMINVGLFFYL